jgi:hypothetical protein
MKLAICIVLWVGLLTLVLMFLAGAKEVSKFEEDNHD